jgi:hypothetical protein
VAGEAAPTTLHAGAKTAKATSQPRAIARLHKLSNAFVVGEGKDGELWYGDSLGPHPPHPIVATLWPSIFASEIYL